MKQAKEEKRFHEVLAQEQPLGEQIYRDIFNSMNKAFSLLEILFNEDGEPVDIRIVDANPAQDRIDGIKAMIGRRVREFLPNLEMKWVQRYANIAKTGKDESFEDWSEANRRWYRVNASRVGAGESNLVAIVYDDITERKAHEKRQEFLLKLSDSIRSLSNPIEIEQAVTALAMDYFSADRSYYCTIDGESAIIQRDSFKGNLPSVAGTYPLSTFELFKKIVDKGQPFIVSDAKTSDILDEPLRELCLQLQVISQ